MVVGGRDSLEQVCNPLTPPCGHLKKKKHDRSWQLCKNDGSFKLLQASLIHQLIGLILSSLKYYTEIDLGSPYYCNP